MALPSEKLAESLKILERLQKQGAVAIRSAQLSRTHRERLVKHGFLQEVMKGWYISTKPDAPKGDSTAWYASFWEFCAAYLNERFGKLWCLSPEQSLLLHAGWRTVPSQLLVRTPKGGNKVTRLPHETSLFDVRTSMPEKKDIVLVEGLQVYSLAKALIVCSSGFFRQYPAEAQTVLAMIRDASDLLDYLLEGGHSTIAGRLAGGLRAIGRRKVADDIVATMRAADYGVREENPFEDGKAVVLSSRDVSPYVNRIKLMWQSMREVVIECFPKPPGLPVGSEAYLARVEDIFVTDAYHSLSIEGYQVTAELIEHVRSGNWNPDKEFKDRQQRDAMAARGYWQAFQAVRQSLSKVLEATNAGEVAEKDHRAWYRELFAPSVAAGILRPADLAGYRNGPVYIRGSKHVPPNRDAVRDMLPALFELLKEEKEASVRVVLGHFFFVYIHPYMDGNGRMGRFLMNLMLASGGYPWTVIPVEKRDKYMAALEAASVEQDIQPFTEFVAGLVESAG